VFEALCTKASSSIRHGCCYCLQPALLRGHKKRARQQTVHANRTQMFDHSSLVMAETTPCSLQKQPPAWLTGQQAFRDPL
jgi:hypothetical protein